MKRIIRVVGCVKVDGKVTRVESTENVNEVINFLATLKNKPGITMILGDKTLPVIVKRGNVTIKYCWIESETMMDKMQREVVYKLKHSVGKDLYAVVDDLNRSMFVRVGIESYSEGLFGVRAVVFVDNYEYKVTCDNKGRIKRVVEY